MVLPEAMVSKVTIKGVTYTPVPNPRMYFRSSGSSAGNGSSSRRGKKETVRRSAPQGSKDLGQTRGRESPLPDQRKSKKRKRNQSSSMQRAVNPSHNHDKVVSVDEAEFIKMTRKGTSAKKRPYIGNVKNSERFMIDEDEPRIPMPASVEYVGMSCGNQSRTTNMIMSPETDNVVINVSSSSSECGNRCSGDDGIEVTGSHSSDGGVPLSLYHEDNGVKKTYGSTEETGDFSKRDENSIEHVQELFNKEEAEEQCNEVDDAIVEQGHQVQPNEYSFANQKVSLGQCRSRDSKKENEKKKGEHHKVPAQKNRTAAAKGSSRVEGVDTKKLIEAVHPVLSEDNDLNCNEETLVANKTTVMQTRKKPTSATEMCRFLEDAIFGTGPRAEEDEDNQVEAPSTGTQNTVPWKFRFDDGTPEVIEKTEQEEEFEQLLNEFDIFSQMDTPQTSQTLNVNPENLCSVAEEMQEERCARGEHVYINKDDEGQVCTHCSFVGLSARDVLPDWGEKIRRPPSKRPSYLADLLKFEEDPPKFKEVQLKSLVKRDASSFNIRDDGTVWDIKPGVKERMYKHQQEGFEFMWRNLAGSINLSELKSSQPRQEGGCIISHAPGTGKTRLTITFLETYMKMFPRCQPLIVAPAGMLMTWQEEFDKWNFPFPFYNLNIANKFSEKESPFVLKQVTGRLKNKKTIRLGKAYSWGDNVSVLGISYHLFEQLTNKNKTKEAGDLGGDDECLKKILLEKPGLAILDEGHYPRNNSSNIWNSFLELKTEKRVVLSGTPFQNNLEELCNTLSLVRPAVASMLEGEKALDEIYMSMSKKNKYKNKGDQSVSVSDINHEDIEKLKSAISPFVNVHKGTILRDRLPGLKEVVISLKPPSVQKTLVEKLKGLNLNSLEFEHMFALISVHPYLLQHCRRADIERLKVNPSLVQDLKLKPNEGAKTKFIIELLRQAVAANEKVLIFSQFISPLELLRDQLESHFRWVVDRQILLMHGDIVPSKRQDIINHYNDPRSEAIVLLASTKCCNEGINLVGASRVVLLDVAWNPSVERQAISRAYRIGQKKVVYTYHLLTSGTNEGHKYSCQIAKSDLSDRLFSSSSDELAEIKSQAAEFEDRILGHIAGQLNSTDTFLKVM